MHASRLLSRIVFAVFCVALACGPARAEIEKQNLTCDNKPCVKWWPKIAPPQHWHAEVDESKEQGVSMFAHDSMASDMRMYTYAVRKADMPKLRSLDDVIARDKENHRDGQALEGKKLTTNGGMQLRSFLFSTPKGDRWDQAAYGEDDAFYIVFYITANGIYELNKYVYDFERFVGSYQGKTKAPKKATASQKSKP